MRWVILVAVAACHASYVPASRDRHVVTSDGDALTRLGTAGLYLRMRAAELCPDGYEVTLGPAGERSVRTTYDPDHRTGMVASFNAGKSDVDDELRCLPPRPPEATRSPGPRGP
jgi:hypothetical protein